MAKIWNEQDDQFLRENYLKLSNQDLAEKFGVSKKSIQGKLRRLGLHRVENDDSASFVSEQEQEQTIPDERPLFNRNRLAVKVNNPAPSEPKPVKYVAREQTERRKRAIREFDNAMRILQEKDKDKAIAEFDFIINTFKGELDIVEKAQVYKRILDKPTIPQAVDAEDCYHQGNWLYLQSDLSGALESFQKTMELDPTFLDAYYNVACIQARLGKVDQALDILAEILTEDESYALTASLDEDFTSLHENEHFVEILTPYLTQRDLLSE